MSFFAKLGALGALGGLRGVGELGELGGLGGLGGLAGAAEPRRGRASRYGGGAEGETRPGLGFTDGREAVAEAAMDFAEVEGGFLFEGTGLGWEGDAQPAGENGCNQTVEYRGAERRGLRIIVRTADRKEDIVFISGIIGR